MNLIIAPDDRLKLPSETFDFQNPQVDPEELVEGMFKVVKENRGFGLAAIQVGIPLQVFIIHSGTDKPLAYFNPKIVHIDQDMEAMNEACLSFPGMVASVKRPKSVRLRAQSPQGEVFTHVYAGAMGRAVQHEYDHLLGITMIKHLSKLKFDRAVKKGLKYGYKNLENVNYNEWK